MEIPLLKDIVVIFSLSIVVLLLFHRLKIPSVVGFLITGILCGPQGLGLVNANEEVRALAEIGIVVLLFTVGMEFSIKKVLDYKRYFFIAGPVQVVLTTVGGFLAGLVIGRPVGESIFLGFLLSLSSTAIVMRILQERAETNSPQGKMILGILIFQDIVVVPMMLLIPMLSGAETDLDSRVFWLLGKGVLILLITFFSALQLVPSILFYVAKTRSRELFLLTVFVICLSVAWITSTVGLSLALVAFLAGLIISESEYSIQAIGDVIPFQDIFTSFFFVSIGMLLDISFFVNHPMAVLFITFGIIALKVILISITGLFMGLPLRPSVLGGLALAQVGEFSFVLAMSGINYGIGTEYLHQLFLTVAVFTMGFTPTLIALSPRLANQALRLPISPKLRSGLKLMEPITEPLKKDHIIIVGYGFSGRNLARSSREANVPYVIFRYEPGDRQGRKIERGADLFWRCYPRKGFKTCQHRRSQSPCSPGERSDCLFKDR